ncbi:TPA: LysR family transcriptional regulator [Vibrio vulnificus]|nr:LysR family transcriptional regulator [Vibrio vulnificus]
MNNPLEFKWLEDFLSLMELGNFSAAAKARFVTQSAFSRRIQALEVWIGVPLFDRTSYPITLTEHGQKFVPYAENLLNQVKVTKEDFAQASLKTDHTVRIVCLHTLAVNLLPKLFLQSAEALSHLNLSVTPSVLGIDAHFQMQEDHSTDLLFTYNISAMRPSLSLEEKLEKCVIHSEKVVPVVAPHLLESLKADQAIPYLSYSEHTFLSKVVEPVLKTLPLTLKPVFETTLSESLVKMAIGGAGVAWVPMHVIEEELAQDRLVIAFEEQKEWQIPIDILCYRSTTNHRAAVDQFWQEIDKS